MRPAGSEQAEALQGTGSYRISFRQEGVFDELQNFETDPIVETTWKNNYSLIVRVVLLIVLKKLAELGRLI